MLYFVRGFMSGTRHAIDILVYKGGKMFLDSSLITGIPLYTVRCQTKRLIFYQALINDMI